MPFGKTVERIVTSVDAPMKRKAKGPVSALRLQSMFYNDKDKLDNRKRGIFSPSGLTKCRRYQQFQLIFAPQNATMVPPIMRRIWHNGHNREEGLVEALTYGVEKIGGHFEPKIRVSIPELFVEGEIDGALYMPDDTDLIVDMKTIGSKWFAQLLRLPLSYKWQFTTYMKATGIPQTICVYENKDTQNPREFFYRYKEETWQKILSVINRVIDHTKREKLIPMQREIDMGRCEERGCSYYSMCMSKPKFSDADGRTEKQRRRFLAVVK